MNAVRESQWLPILTRAKDSLKLSIGKCSEASQEIRKLTQCLDDFNSLLDAMAKVMKSHGCRDAVNSSSSSSDFLICSCDSCKSARAILEKYGRVTKKGIE